MKRTPPPLGADRETIRKYVEDQLDALAPGWAQLGAESATELGRLHNGLTGSEPAGPDVVEPPWLLELEKSMGQSGRPMGSLFRLPVMRQGAMQNWGARIERAEAGYTLVVSTPVPVTSMAIAAASDGDVGIPAPWITEDEEARGVLLLRRTRLNLGPAWQGKLLLFLTHSDAFDKPLHPEDLADRIRGCLSEIALCVVITPGAP